MIILQIIVIVIATVLPAVYLPMAALEPVARLIVPGIALVAAGIFPTMTLVIGSLRTGKLSVYAANRLYSHLSDALRLLSAQFAFGLLSILGIVLAVAVNHSSMAGKSEIIIRGLVCFTTFCIAIFVRQAFRSIQIFFALLEREKDLAEKKARERGEKFFEKAAEDAKIDPDNYADNTYSLDPKEPT